MRKVRAALGLGLALLCLTSAALAGRENPYRQEALRFSQPALPTLRLAEHGAPAFEIAMLQTPTLTTPGVWQVLALTEGNWLYQIYICEQAGDELITHYHTYWPGEGDTFTYDVNVPGTFIPYAQVTNAATGEKYAVIGEPFTVADDGAHQSAAQKAAEVVAACRADGIAGEWNTALWLHDWLIGHASYDMAYRYYSAEGVLLRGTGVCDSYAAAYRLLLNTAGITCQVSASATHAWNAALIDGLWTYIDCTWDDEQQGETGLQSRFLRHIYFGLDSTLLAWEHGSAYSPRFAANSLACHYLVHTDLLSGLLAEQLAAAQAHLNAAEGRFTLPAEAPLRLPNAAGTGYTTYRGTEAYCYACLAHLMRQQPWQAHGLALTGSVTWQGQGRLLRFDLHPKITWAEAVHLLCDLCADTGEATLADLAWALETLGTASE